MILRSKVLKRAQESLRLNLNLEQTTNLIINFDHDEDWILDDDERTLESVGIGT